MSDLEGRTTAATGTSRVTEVVAEPAGRDARFTRRRLIHDAVFGLAAGSALSTLGCRSGPTPTPVPDFTMAFLTDPHVFAEKGSATGLERAASHAMAQPRPPEAILAGGDLAFDILRSDKAGADAQYDLYDEAVKSVVVPIYPTVGNHDCLGVYEDSGVAPTDPLFGKKYFNQRFGLERSYYSFDHESWHFVVLDTIGIEERGYKGWVDEEQIAWLADDLASSNRPTVVVGHIPLFSNYIEWVRGTGEGIPSGVAVVNSHQVAEVLVGHPVQLVLAGHLHINEVFRYKGIEFATVGAVSGNWWDGPRDGFEEGYALLEFQDDQVTWRYVDYGWEAESA